jgi:O-antigen ligase
MMTELLLPAFFVQVESRLEKFLRISYILVALLIIAMSRSAGSWVICAACIVFVATIHLLIRMPRKDASAIVFFLIGFVIVAGVFVCSNFDTLMYAIGKDPTMTGRTLIWSNLMTSVKKQPLLGYGFMAFWGAEQGESINTALAMHWPGMGYAENGVLELWLELGAVGVFLFLLVFLRAVKDAIHCFLRDPSPAVMWYVSVLFFLTVCNIEAGLLLSTSDLGVIVSFVAFAGLRREAHEDYGAKLILSPS